MPTHVTANDSSSSAARPSELELPTSPLLAAWRDGRDRDLLAPVTFLAPGETLRPGPPGIDRGAIAAGLAQANRSYGHPDADRLAAKLADPETRVVVAGQQAALFGGPLYSLLKMAAVTKWAAALEADGIPAVGLFWIATEDHDWDEAAHAQVWSRGGVERLELGPDAVPLVPVGLRAVGPEVEEALAALGERFSYEPYAAWIAQLASWYRPDSRFGEAFARVSVGLLGERCPLLVDALLPALKTAERPFLRALVEGRHAVSAALDERNAAIEDRGYRLQVGAAPGVAPLSLLAGAERRRIVWEGETDFRLRGLDETRPVSSLLETVADNPSVISPNALARPAIQDAVFGTALHILGPGELAYFAQAAPIYDTLGLEPPAVTPRPQALLMERKQLDLLDDLELPLEVVLESEAELDQRLAGATATEFVATARERTEEAIEILRRGALAVDGGLEGPWSKTRDHLLRGLTMFEDKVTKAAARRDEVGRRRLDALRAYCRPGGVLHERVLSAAHFRGKWGPGFGEALWRALSIEAGGLQVIVEPGAEGEA